MKRLAILLAFGALLAPVARANSRGNHSFGFNALSIGGAADGNLFLTGSGVYDPALGFVKGGGFFHCRRNIRHGPLAGCKAGEGARWEAVEILASTGFKEGSSASELPKITVTDDNTLVMRAEFFRSGDGRIPSFTALMFVSAVDEDSNAPGVQNVWIQGVGCGDGHAHFQWQRSEGSSVARGQAVARGARTS